MRVPPRWPTPRSCCRYWPLGNAWWTSCSSRCSRGRCHDHSASVTPPDGMPAGRPQTLRSWTPGGRWSREEVEGSSRLSRHVVVRSSWVAAKRRLLIEHGCEVRGLRSTFELGEIPTSFEGSLGPVA